MSHDEDEAGSGAGAGGTGERSAGAVKSWTPEGVELLKKLWAEGLSCSQIAAQLGGGISRNAVIGKVHRLGLDRSHQRRVSAPRSGGLANRLGGPGAKASAEHQMARRIAADHVPANRRGGSKALLDAVRTARPMSFGKGRSSSPPSGRSPLGSGPRPTAESQPGGAPWGSKPEIEAEPFELQVEKYVPPERRLSLLQLNEHTCKWPIGDPLTADFYFCGATAESGRPYCDFHVRRAYHQVDGTPKVRTPTAGFKQLRRDRAAERETV